jgi:rRNA maturation endonuclease Nob1
MKICVLCGFICEDDCKECPKCGGKILISSPKDENDSDLI